MNVTKLNGKPVSDELLAALEGEDLMTAYLVALLTPEQKQKATERLVVLFPRRAA